MGFESGTGLALMGLGQRLEVSAQFFEAPYAIARGADASVGRALDVDVKIRRYPILPLMIAGHVCETVCRPFKIPPPIFPRRVDWYRQNRAFDISRARREIGYEPRIGLDEGLRRTASWYRDEGLL